MEETKRIRKWISMGAGLEYLRASYRHAEFLVRGATAPPHSSIGLSFERVIPSKESQRVSQTVTRLEISWTAEQQTTRPHSIRIGRWIWPSPKSKHTRGEINASRKVEILSYNVRISGVLQEPRQEDVADR